MIHRLRVFCIYFDMTIITYNLFLVFLIRRISVGSYVFHFRTHRNDVITYRIGIIYCYIPYDISIPYTYIYIYPSTYHLYRFWFYFVSYTHVLLHVERYLRNFIRSVFIRRSFANIVYIRDIAFPFSYNT